MSTTPGDDTWADAGLAPPEDTDPPAHDEEELDEHRPDPARPDLRDEASEPDVVDQAMAVPADEAEDYRED